MLAALFIGITWATGNPYWDAVGSIVIGLLLIASAMVLGVEMKSLLIGEASSFDFQNEFSREMILLMPNAKIFHFFVFILFAEDQ